MRTPAPIAVIQGADGAVIQRLFADFAAHWDDRARIAGVIEAGRGRRESHLAMLGGPSFALFQDLGAGAAGCALDPGGVLDACAATCNAIAGGADLVILSKFGKLEAESGSGLMGAFTAAVEAGIPVLTSVAPRHAAAWGRFAEGLYVMLPAEMAAVEDWWGAICPPPACGRG